MKINIQEGPISGTVDVRFAVPISIQLFNVIRKALYDHVPVWSFDDLKVGRNTCIASVPSELLVNKMKNLVIRARPVEVCCAPTPERLVPRLAAGTADWPSSRDGNKRH